MKLEESRILQIEGRVFRLANFKKLATILNQEYQLISAKNEFASLSFTVDCSDNSTYTSEHVELFNEDGDLSEKKAKRVDMKLWCHRPLHSIEINIQHANEPTLFDNRIKVSGEDRNWVAGVLSSIEQVINSVEPQNHIVKKYRLIFYCLAFISIVWIGKIVFEFLIGKLGTDEALKKYHDNYIVFNMTLFPAYMGIALIALTTFQQRIRSLWPSVEVQTGPEHEQIEKNRRKWIATFIVLIISPVLQTVLSYLISN